MASLHFIYNQHNNQRTNYVVVSIQSVLFASLHLGSDVEDQDITQQSHLFIT